MLPFLAWLPAVGLWERTTLSWLWLVTSCCCTVAGKPWEPSVASADPNFCPTTFGTVGVGGALATTIVIVDPGGSMLPPIGV